MSRRLLLGAGSMGAGIPAPIEPDPEPEPETVWRQVTNRTGWRTAGLLGTSEIRTSRLFMTARTAVSAIKVALGAVDGSHTVAGTLIINGTTYPLAFGGAANAVLDTQYESAVSDPIAVDIAVGDVIEFRRRSSPARLSATNLRWPAVAGEGNQPGDHLAGEWPSTAPTDVNPWETFYADAPLRLLGAVPADAPFESWILSGDSITELGYQMRALEDAGKAWTNFGDWGDRVGNVNTWAPQYANRYGPDSTPWSHAICSYGVNDFGAGTTALALRDVLWTHWTWLKGAQGNQVWQTTILPSTTSTDGWTTTTNQSLRPGISDETILLNDWLRSGATHNGLSIGDPDHPLTGYIEAADTVETVRNSGIWKAGYTSDGGHPNETATSALAAVVSAFLATI